MNLKIFFSSILNAKQGTTGSLVMQTKIEHAAQISAQIATHVGGGMSTLSGIWMWLGVNHDQIAAIGVIVGIAVGCTGLCINAYFQIKNHRHIKRISTPEELKKLLDRE
jgi:NADH:ubiquinone oxidoreductase subunit E